MCFQKLKSQHNEKYCFIPRFKEFYIPLSLINSWNVITNKQYSAKKKKKFLHFFLPTPGPVPQSITPGRGL